MAVSATSEKIHHSGDAPPPVSRETYDEVMTPNYAPMEIIPERGEGSRLWDTNGNEYIDFAAGIAVSALGHAHPALIEALNEQARKFWHVRMPRNNSLCQRLLQRRYRISFREIAKLRCFFHRAVALPVDRMTAPAIGFDQFFSSKYRLFLCSLSSAKGNQNCWQ